METTTPVGDPRTDLAKVLTASASRPDIAGRHGDVDINGDLVDERQGDELGDELETVLRLRAAITAATPAAAEAQLRSVVSMLRRRGA